ncbi:MAG TPA: Tim44-like domain-containing protein, partial [Accumulibacter sp.]|nr:Tim44-like domain-containing protein [Accumulibacter sp.]
MRSFASILAAVLVFGLSAISGDAEAAKRFGGGQSAGMQRQSVAPQKSPAAAPTHAAPTAGAAASGAAAAAPKRSWMGPLAGLAAGIGLAALASHFGFGEELASMMMFALIAMLVLAVIGFMLRRRAAANPMAGNNLRYASATADNAPGQRSPVDMALPASRSTPAADVSTQGNIPADFDRAAFERNAKVNFIRLQAANDAGNLDDLREFTTPEMFAEIKMNLADRSGTKQQTDVVSIEATVLDVSEENNRYIVSVHFNGLIREEQNAPAEPVDEIWHMVKPRTGQGGWIVAGIQQV